MRNCEACNCADVPWFDIEQRCSCPVGPLPRKPGVENHESGCNHVRHSVTPYRIRLDRGVDKQRLIRKGFVIRDNSGFEWAERMLCRLCINKWEFTELQRRDYERACKAKRQDYEETYCQMLVRN